MLRPTAALVALSIAALLDGVALGGRAWAEGRADEDESTDVSEADGRAHWREPPPLVEGRADGRADWLDVGAGTHSLAGRSGRSGPTGRTVGEPARAAAMPSAELLPERYRCPSPSRLRIAPATEEGVSRDWASTLLDCLVEREAETPRPARRMPPPVPGPPPAPGPSRLPSILPSRDVEPATEAVPTLEPEPDEPGSVDSARQRSPSEPDRQGESRKLSESSPFFVDDAPPPGFESLGEPRALWVDLVFNGRKVGTTIITATNETIEFDSPDDAASMLDAIEDPERLARLLSVPLASNADRLCFQPDDPVGCGRLVPDPVAVLFDENALLLELFVAPALQSLQSSDDFGAVRYLAPPERRPSSLLSLRSVASDVEGGERSLDLSGRLLASYGRGHVAAAGDYGTREEEARLRELKLSHHASGHELTLGGYGWSPSEVWTDIDLLGVGFSTSLNTRLDLARAFGTELVVFLEQRSVVQLIVDDRVYAGDSYSPGNQLLDTSTLPDGTYPIEIRVSAADGSTRSEFRTFTKSTRLPPQGEPRFDVTAGLARLDAAPLPERDAAVVAGFALENRIGDRASWRIGTAQLDSRSFAHAGLLYLGERLSLQGALAAGAERTVGARLLSGWRRGTTSLGASYRYFSSGIARREDPALAMLYPRDGVQWNLTAGRRFGRYGVTLGAGRSRSIVDGETRQDSMRYNLGLRRQLLLGGGMRGRFGAGLRAVDGERFASLTLDLYFDRGAWRSAVGLDANVADGEVDTGLLASADRSTRSEYLDWGGGVSARSGTEDSASARLWIEHSLFRASASSQLSRRSNGTSRSAIATFGTHIALDGDGAVLGDASAARAGVIVAVQGEPHGAPFDIFVNERLVGSGKIGTPRFLELRPFETYSLELAARGKLLLAFGEGLFDFVLYPGNVQRIAVVAAPKMLLIGSLVDERGESLAAAAIETGTNPQRSDGGGIVQVEVTPGRELAVETADGRRCTFLVPVPEEPTDLLVARDPLVCVAPAPPE